MLDVFQKPTMVPTNGITMAYYEQGEGIPVILCHGFPELAYSWRSQLPALANAGFRAIAPDQRGYGLTSAPVETESYDMPHLMADLIGLLDALELEKAVFCGHDWGGLVTWNIPLYYPDRVLGVIGVNTPFVPRPPMDPIELFRAVYGDLYYVVQLQEPGVVEGKLAKDIGNTLRGMFKKNAVNTEMFMQEAFDFVAYLQQDHHRDETVHSEEDLQVYIDAFRQKGLTGPINWYRNFTRNWQLSEGREERIAHPCLMISAADDPVLTPQMAEGMEQFVPNVEKHIIENCGHWTQEEQPEQLNQLMMTWLQKTFQ